MPTLPITPQQRLEHANRSKADAGWSWLTVQAKLGWKLHHLNQIKALKRPIRDEELAYLQTVAEAVTAIPVPEPAPMEPENLRVMLLDDIATKLADEYSQLSNQDAASPDELAGARYMISRLAERFGVANEVRELIAENTIKSVVVGPSKITTTILT